MNCIDSPMSDINDINQWIDQLISWSMALINRWRCRWGDGDSLTWKSKSCLVSWFLGFLVSWFRCSWFLCFKTYQEHFMFSGRYWTSKIFQIVLNGSSACRGVRIFQKCQLIGFPFFEIYENSILKNAPMIRWGVRTRISPIFKSKNY